MQKERLTIHDIRADVHTKMKEGCKQLAVFSVLFLAALGLILASFKVDVLEFAFKWFLLIVAETVLLFFIIRQMQSLAMLHKSLKTGPCVVKDKLVAAELKDRYSRKLRDERYHLHFSNYGNYVIPTENYKWSAAYEMDDKAVFYCASCGDEFYLVLSHTGKILLAYNMKMFELAECIKEKIV